MHGGALSACTLLLLLLLLLPGVISTEVGYSQGKVEEPSYEQVCSGSTGHAEVVQVTYDPQQVGRGWRFSCF
jgi:peptide methionine sulfoxide reductase MsrA